jgi:hypothetical protein
VAEAFTGTPGRYVKLKDTVRGFKEIVEGKHDDLPEQAFYMVGTIEEAIEKVRELPAKDQDKLAMALLTLAGEELTEDEAQTIENYADLFLRFVFNQSQ